MKETYRVVPKVYEVDEYGYPTDTLTFWYPEDKEAPVLWSLEKRKVYGWSVVADFYDEELAKVTCEFLNKQGGL